MNRIFFLIILISIIASWFIFDLSRYLPPDLVFNKGIKYESKDVQNRLADELKNQNIPHRMRNDGIIDYRKKDDKKVKEIADKIYSETSGTSASSPEVDEIIYKCRNLIVERKFDEALNLLNEGISKYDKTAILYNFRAIVWSYKGEDDKTIVDCTLAIDLSQNYYEAYWNRGLAWLRKKEYEKAIKDFTLSITINSRYAQAYFDRAIAFSELDQFQNALLDYKKAIKINADWAEKSFRTDIPADPIHLFQTSLIANALMCSRCPAGAFLVRFNKRIRQSEYL